MSNRLSKSEKRVVIKSQTKMYADKYLFIPEVYYLYKKFGLIFMMYCPGFSLQKDSVNAYEEVTFYYN